MRIIISPAKKMKMEDDSLQPLGLPAFLDETREIMDWIKSLSLSEAQKLWGCNSKLAEQNYRRFQDMDLEKRLTPALMSYEGIQYQYMAPTVFEDKMLAYVQEHLRILSGFYGVLRPMDGVTPYRLEMQAKTNIHGVSGLYRYWGRKLYEEVLPESHIIINLASKEYSKCIENYLQPEDCLITCVFGEMSGDRVIQKGTYAKMARGEMVRFMAENQIGTPEKLKEFQELDYHYSPDLSSERNYVFLKKGRT